VEPVRAAPDHDHRAEVRAREDRLDHFLAQPQRTALVAEQRADDGRFGPAAVKLETGDRLRDPGA
jgi:hypothetical protein